MCVEWEISVRTCLKEPERIVHIIFVLSKRKTKQSWPSSHDFERERMFV